MGLDNGIIIKKFNKYDIPRNIKDPSTIYPIDGEMRLEIAYWRKCWNIRGKILNTLSIEDDAGITSLTREDLGKIIKILVFFCSRANYDADENGSIWTYEEFINGNLTTISRLSWLYGYMETNPEVEVIFYDSY